MFGEGGCVGSRTSARVGNEEPRETNRHGIAVSQVGINEVSAHCVRSRARWPTGWRRRSSHLASRGRSATRSDECHSLSLVASGRSVAVDAGVQVVSDQTAVGRALLDRRRRQLIALSKAWTTGFFTSASAAAALNRRQSRMPAHWRCFSSGVPRAPTGTHSGRVRRRHLLTRVRSTYEGAPAPPTALRRPHDFPQPATHVVVVSRT